MILTKQPESKKLVSTPPADADKQDLIDCLLNNKITLEQLKELREYIITDKNGAVYLSDIIQRIYDLNEKFILELSAVDGLLRKLNDLKNAKRNKRFKKKIVNGFRKREGEKIILAEGDSWFNYPVILTDLIDRISMEKNFAVYSLAAGGDWLLNMLTARHYVEELSVLHPDVFLISGGGNDLVGSSRLAAVVNQDRGDEYSKCQLAHWIIDKARKVETPLDKARFSNGVQFLSKDFFALLMFFHLQYSYLINGILKNAQKPGDKFFGIKIITQGYDYALPSFDKRFGPDPLQWYVPFIRMFLGHGGWLKRPLMTRGILDEVVQKDILYAMIYLFNEMMIDVGRLFNKDEKKQVFHIDSRGSVGKDGWADELHPKPKHFMQTGNCFIACINESSKPTYEHVFVVNPQNPKP